MRLGLNQGVEVVTSLKGPAFTKGIRKPAHTRDGRSSGGIQEHSGGQEKDARPHIRKMCALWEESFICIKDPVKMDAMMPE